MTQETAESADKVKFPKRIKHRGRVLATIYAKSKSYPLYRLVWSVSGKRRMKAFPRYGEAKKYGEGLVKDLAQGSQVTALTPDQASNALAALERLQSFYQSTGRRVSLLAAVSEYAEAYGKLNGCSLTEAVDGYLRTVATVQRRDLNEAVESFLTSRAPLAKSVNGHRAQVSLKYVYNREIQLRKFAKTFPGTALCDLTREHIDTFIASLSEFSAKSRNHYRAAVRQFLEWAVRKDYLPAAHRLGEADTMRPERANTSETLFYTPKEFANLLAVAEGPMKALIAIGGLAGLRTAELLRLDWADVWRVRGNIEITAGKSKTRARRLVEISPALAAWLNEFRELKTGQPWPHHEITFQEHFRELCTKANLPRKKNGLRHGFCTYHFALNGNENLTAAQAGNSPTMIHAHHKGLATKKEGKQWFSVKPKAAKATVIMLPDLKSA